MKRHRFTLVSTTTLLLSVASALGAQPTPMFREWNQPLAPFHIAGPLYYVGMAQATSLLITTPKGHILIDGAFAESAGAILENVRTLGFKPQDIRILLSTHAHLDHAGGLAELKARTKARLYAGAADVPALASGDGQAFPPVTADVAIQDGQAVTLDDVTVRAISTPGHTKGCTSWASTIQDQGKPLRVLVVGGTTAFNYRLMDNSEYPTIATDFERTFARLSAEPCDIFIEGHGFFFGLEEKRTGRRSFVDPEGYKTRLAIAERAFRELLERQRNEKPKEAR